MIEVVTTTLALYALTFTVLQLGMYALAHGATQSLILERRRHDGEVTLFGVEPPLTILVPAHNEETNVVGSVRSVLNLRYPSIEVVAINDGSRDGTLAALTAAFDLMPSPPVYRQSIATQPVRGVYRSRLDPRLWVVDKENGGKGDAMNAGINLAVTPLVCALDADSILEPDALLRVVRPFLTDGRVVASGGTVRIANGCRVVGGRLVEAGLPRSWLPLMQTIEYLRGISVDRMGWDRLGAVLIISGAFGVFRRDALLAVGGYRPDAVGEDMELVLRLHRYHLERGIDYAIRFKPDPVCWTEAPEDVASLRSQRSRWHYGLGQSHWMNRGLMFAGGGSRVGLIAVPFSIVFEWLTPLVETFGYLFVLWGLATGRLGGEFVLWFIASGVLLAVTLNSVALLVDSAGRRSFASLGEYAVLQLAGLVELVGYRQLNIIWQLNAIWKSLTGQRMGWGVMHRSGSWHTAG